MQTHDNRRFIGWSGVEGLCEFDREDRRGGSQKKARNVEMGLCRSSKDEVGIMGVEWSWGRSTNADKDY